MEIDRRSLMKGMLASGALLALGVPSWAFVDQPPRRPKHCLLVLNGTCADEAFVRGAKVACTAMTHEELRTVHLQGGLFTDMDQMVNLLKQSRGARIIAILEDASAVIFLELARPAGVRMLSMGTHACSTEGVCHIRHELASTSQDHSAGGLLASQLIRGKGSFSIVESYFHDALQRRPVTAWSAPEFCSYRSAEPDSIHLHCSGLSLPEGCRLLHLDTTEQWISLPPQVQDRDSRTPQFVNWVESVGYAVTAAAIGKDSVKETCAGRAFVHQTNHRERTEPQQRFMSFVMDL